VPTPFSETDHTFRADDGAEIFYRSHRVAGARGVLLFVHGAASNHTRWSEFLGHTTLTSTWDTVRLDLRGHARSIVRGTVGIARWCDDLAQLLDAEGYTRAVLVGHSLGANIALSFAQRYPRRVAALLLIDPAHPETLNLALPRSVARALLGVASVTTLGLNALGLRRSKPRELDLEQLDRRARALLAQHRDAEMEQLYASTREDLKYTPTATYLQDIAGVFKPLPVPPTEVSVMLLLSAGSDARAMKCNHRLAARMPQCEVVEIPCNHWILTAAPEAARAAMEKWISALETARR
jgi:pimeloyl-ACP methyl ester carboxylesterase